jgi:hypothetical protein
MVDVQEFPIANMPEGPWLWWPHGRMHHHATQSVASCKNMATYATAVDADVVPGPRIILCVDLCSSGTSWQCMI